MKPKLRFVIWGRGIDPEESKSTLKNEGKAKSILKNEGKTGNGSLGETEVILGTETQGYE